MAVTRLSLPQEHTGDRQTQAMQATAGRTATTLNGCPFVVGNLVEGLVFTSGVARSVDHKLGRAVQGYWVVRSDTLCTVFDSGGNDKSITMTAFTSAPTGTLSVWFF